MQKKMSVGLIGLLTHKASVDNVELSLSKAVLSEVCFIEGYPAKAHHLWMYLSLPN